MSKLGAAIAAAASCVVTSAHAVDVVGIELGSDAMALKASMLAANPELAITNIKKPDGRIIGFDGRKMVGGDSVGLAVDHFVNLFDPRGRVWFVARAQKYEKGSRPTVEATLSALHDKYGAHSFGSTSQMEWQFDRAGHLFQGAQQQGPCWSGARPGAYPVTINTTSPTIFVPNVFNGYCGVRITAALTANKADGMVDTLVVTISDSASQYRQIESDKADAEQKEQSELNAERRKGVQPGI